MTKKNKTPMQEIFENNRGLIERLIQENKKDKNRVTSLSRVTIRKAISGKNVNFNTKFQILVYLLDLGLIRQGEYTTRELFGE